MAKKAPEPPDLGPMAQGSMEVAQMAQDTALEQLAWAREQDANNNKLLERVVKSQEAVQGETLKNAQTDRARYQSIYQPLEDNLVKEFQNYDTPEQQDINAGRAVADVNTQFDAARRNSLQRLESYGVDPSQTRNAALDLGTRTQQAAAAAGAASASRQSTTQTGRALRAEALSIGKGYPSNVAGSYGQSIQAGNSMMNNANSTTATSSGALQGAGGYMNTAIGGYGQAGNTATQGYGNQMQQFNANQATTNAALGAVGGIAGMMMADGGPTRRRGITIDHDTGAIDEGPSDGSGIDDQVKINASVGEYVIPADVVQIKGREFFDKLLDRYHTPAETQRQDMANGGPPKAQSYVPHVRSAAPAHRMRTQRMAIG